MFVREVFAITVLGKGELGFRMPMTAEVAEGVTGIFEEAEDGFRVVLERRVDPTELTVEAHSGLYELRSDGERVELPALRVPGNSNVHVMDFTTAITFLTDVPMSVSASRDSEVVPENGGDVAILDSLGARRVYRRTMVKVNVRTFDVEVSPKAITALVAKTVGLRLYADAVAHPADVAKVRELWRVLESAFGLQNGSLTAALADYPPAQELEFTKAELDALLILRGQISHSGNKGGLDELLRAGRKASEVVGRLKCLVERVVLTKASWGSRGTAVDELTLAVSWVNADGGITFRQ